MAAPADRPGRRSRLAAAGLILALLGVGTTRGAGTLPPLPADAEKRLAAVFDGTSSAFVLLDPSRNRTVRYDEERCRLPLTPFSTFKIPNTLIALDSGLVRDPGATVRFDPMKHPPQLFWPATWAHDQTLRTAFRDSVVWFYQDLAVAAGPERMARYLDQFHYGNRDISGGQDRFWLGSTLKISADNQVEFLRAFYGNRLGLDPATTRIAKGIFVFEKGDGFTLSAKTGGGEVGEGKALGWFVGYLETANGPAFFALNTDGDSFEAIRDKRIDLTKRALRALGLLPPEAPADHATAPETAPSPGKEK